MKRLIFTLAILAVLVFAAVAPASVYMGGGWYLHAETAGPAVAPGQPQNGLYIGIGWITNAANQLPTSGSLIETCIQVREADGNYVNKSGTCNSQNYSEVTSYYTPFVSGHTYRTWVWGYQNGYYTTYTTGPFTAP